MATKEEIETRRAERKAAHDKARDEQELSDLEAIDALEQESSEPLHTMTANGFKPGVPVRMAFRDPTPLEYKRYSDMVGRAMLQSNDKMRRDAQATLAQSCWVYPAADSAARKAVLEAVPGILLALAVAVAKAGEATADEEGKG